MVDGEASKCNSRQTDSEDDEEHGKRCISDVASRNQTNSRKHESCIEQRSLSLGLEMLFRNVSVSFRSRENLGRSRSRSHLEQKTEGLGLNVSFYKLVFNDKSSLKLVLINRLSVGLLRTACRSRSLCFSHHRLVKFMYYQPFPLLTYQFDAADDHAIT